MTDALLLAQAIVGIVIGLAALAALWFAHDFYSTNRYQQIPVAALFLAGWAMVGFAALLNHAK